MPRTISRTVRDEHCVTVEGAQGSVTVRLTRNRGVQRFMVTLGPPFLGGAGPIHTLARGLLDVRTYTCDEKLGNAEAAARAVQTRPPIRFQMVEEGGPA